MKACSFAEHAFFLDPLRLRFVTEAAQEGPADMTRKSSFILLAGLAALAACDQSGVGGGGGGGGGGDLDANAAAPAAAETSAEAQSDPANTLENQAAALSGAGETGNATGAEDAAGNDAVANAQAGAEANSQ